MGALGVALGRWDRRDQRGGDSLLAFLRVEFWPQNCKDAHGNWTLPAEMEQLKAEAKASKLSNLFLPSDFLHEGVSGFLQEEIAIMAEIVGRCCWLRAICVDENEPALRSLFRV